jgi:predicted SnoaL-like aldol condensation-catalyzing enzyme
MENIMRNMSLALLTLVFFTACDADNGGSKPKELSNKEKVVALLNTIETGAQEPVGYINPNKYIQHNLGVADGLAGFGELLGQLPEGSAKVEVQRVFEDGDYVFAHTKYNFFGPKVGFDIFRFENGLIVEHWDNLQEITEETASGRTQWGGPSEIKDLDKTDENREVVEKLIKDVFLGAAPEKVGEYISSEQYDQHNPAVGDGLDNMLAAFQALAEAGTPMQVTKNHRIFAEGNFVLSVSEGNFNGHVAYYDLFRLEDGKIVEHWDTIELIPDESEWKNSNGKFGF